MTLGWRPASGWDRSLKLRRRVGQISFYDFLAQPNLSEERENSGNPDLVPPQSWEAEIEAGKSLGAWGQTRLTLYYHLIEDIVDIIPIGEDGEAVGNLPSATRARAPVAQHLPVRSDRLEGRQARPHRRLRGHQRARSADSGEMRAISGTRNRWIEASFRHDIPGSDWAWGMDAEHGHYARNFYLTEINRSWEGPVWARLRREQGRDRADRPRHRGSTTCSTRATASSGRSTTAAGCAIRSLSSSRTTS